MISRVEQKVHIAAHTWDPRDLPEKCKKKVHNYIQVLPGVGSKEFGDGPGTFDDPFKF